MKEKKIIGFDMKGHAGFDDFGKDIVCASVSSVAYMTANAITDVYGAKADCSVDDGRMTVRLLDEDNASSLDILKALEFHLKNLAKDYPKNLKVIYHGGVI